MVAQRKDSLPPSRCTRSHGTEKIEETLAGLLADVRRADGSALRIARIDADAARNPSELAQQLAQVHAGEVDLLVGTQMIAKGHDFRRVTMVAALNPDGALFSADFRAPERLFALLMQLLGVPPGQFVLLVAVSQLAESLQHANLKVRFGALRYLFVSPQFHRFHHAIGVGHQSPGAVMGGHNFGVLFPWWDLLLGTARYDDVYLPTGISDQVDQHRDYGRGFWRQQWLGLKRIFEPDSLR